MSKRIPLSQGKFAIVDDADFDWLSQWKWSYNAHKRTDYAVRAIGRHTDQVTIYMHRIIANPPSGKETDHINGNGLDNRRCNLRACTRSQNHMNRRKQANCSSQYKGVSWDKARQKWWVQISKCHGGIHRIGRFDDEEKAARTYDRFALEYFGTFAHLNFPEEAADAS